MLEHGHRAVCGGALGGDLLGALELEAVVEVVQEQAFPFAEVCTAGL